MKHTLAVAPGNDSAIDIKLTGTAVSAFYKTLRSVCTLCTVLPATFAGRRERATESSGFHIGFDQRDILRSRETRCLDFSILLSFEKTCFMLVTDDMRMEVTYGSFDDLENHLFIWCKEVHENSNQKRNVNIT